MAKITWRRTDAATWLSYFDATPADYTHYYRFDSVCGDTVNKDVYLGTFEFTYYVRFRGQVFPGEIV